MKKLLIVFLTFFGGIAQGQDMFNEHLYSADRVMKNRENISLTDAQAEKIKNIQLSNAAQFSALKSNLDALTVEMRALLNTQKPNKQQVLSIMDLMLATENQLKKKQLENLIEIKNELTESQQATLESTKSYTVSGISPSLQTNGPKIAFGRPIAGSGSKSGTSPKVSVQVAGIGNSSSPAIYLKSQDGLKKISEANMSSINPDNIESVEVLKDKSATDKFGEDGVNGVIIITLKKGKENYFQQK